MPTYRYILAPYTKGSKGKCPSCGNAGKFRFYLDLKTNTYLSSEYGICDREQKCGHHLSPYDVRPNNEPIVLDNKDVHAGIILTEDDGSFNVIPKELFEKSFKKQFQDNLSVFLIETFGKTKAIKALKMYKVGYSKIFGGQSTVFWQVDNDLQIRTGKIFKYTKDGKRDKKGYPKITWVHTRYKGNYKLKQCFFGSHLLAKYPDKPVMVVESEKTAIIMSIVRPNHIWLASTQLNGLNDEKLKTLDGRDVTLIPDKGCFKLWQKKAEEYLDNTIKMSTFVEETDSLGGGDDIADYILNFKS